MITICRYRITRYRVRAPIATREFFRQANSAASDTSSRNAGAKVNFDKPTARTFCAGRD